MVWIILAFAALLTAGSLWLRVVYYRSNIAAPENRSTPLSLAIQELVATAGGIYLAAVALTSFMRIDIPEKITLMTVSMDPLAVSSITAAIIQPFLARMIKK